MGRLLEYIFPALICAREGHDFHEFQSMGPHMNNPEEGVDGGVFYGLRCVVRCRTCNKRP